MNALGDHMLTNLSRRLRLRLDGFQPDSPYPLRVYWSGDFAHAPNQEGTEWFSCRDNLAVD
jgi:hypothetical protein